MREYIHSACVSGCSSTPALLMASYARAAGQEHTVCSASAVGVTGHHLFDQWGCASRCVQCQRIAGVTHSSPPGCFLTACTIGMHIAYSGNGGVHCRRAAWPGCVCTASVQCCCPACAVRVAVAQTRCVFSASALCWEVAATVLVSGWVYVSDALCVAG